MLWFLLPLETDLRKHWYSLCQRMFCLSSLLRILTCDIFWSLSHFEFIFVYSVRMCSNFIDLHAAGWLSQHHLLKKLSCSHFIFFPPPRLIAHRCADMFLGSLLYSTDPCVYFCANTIMFWLLLLLFIFLNDVNIIYSSHILCSTVSSSFLARSTKNKAWFYRKYMCEWF